MPRTRSAEHADMASLRSPATKATTTRWQHFSLSPASSLAELETAAALRRRIFLERRCVTFDEDLEARRDRQGHVFLLFDQQTPVAVGRVLCHPPRPTATDLSHIARSGGADSEVGRVCCLASRQTHAYPLLLLTLGARWLLEHTPLRRYVAYCHPKLVFTYRKFGAVAGEELTIPGRADAYRLVSGEYRDAARFGSHFLGLDPRLPGVRR